MRIELAIEEVFMEYERELAEKLEECQRAAERLFADLFFWGLPSRPAPEPEPAEGGSIDVGFDPAFDVTVEP